MLIRTEAHSSYSENSTASNPSRAESLSVNGTDYNGNTTRIDGAVNYYDWFPYLIAYVPPADTAENVSITTNSFNAEHCPGFLVPPQLHAGVR